MRALAIAACLVGAVAALALAAMTLMDLSLSGFPDSHVTDYGKATDAPRTILAWVEVGCGVLLLALAFSRIWTKARAIGLVVVLAAFAIVAMVAEVGVPWYFGTHLGLDNGIGG